MSLKLKDLDFAIALTSSHTPHNIFPTETAAIISLKRPDPNKRKYKLKIQVQADTLRKAEINPLGFVMAKISTCSQGLQISWEEKQNELFKGYRFRPAGAYRNDQAIRDLMKDKKTNYLGCYAEISIDFNVLDTTRTNKFDTRAVEPIHIGKHVLVYDISDIRLYGAPLDE